MLRRKFLLIFGSLVALLLTMAISAIWMLQGILSDLNHINKEAWGVIQSAHNLTSIISTVEIELYQLSLGRKRHLDTLIDSVETMDEELKRVEQSYVVHLPENEAFTSAIRVSLPIFSSKVGKLGTAQHPEFVSRYRQEAMMAAVELRQNILALSQSVRAHGEAEQTDLTNRFRWLVLGLTVVFLLVINVSIIVLLRMASMVVRPVEKLVEATRQLAEERFEHRVELDQKDEFDELARAYNHLAGQLQANEQRKLETLGQVALTLNHELNNAIAIIALQLELLNRQANGNPRVEKCAREIHESLARMTRTVESLKRIRRIVLTDYVEGVKMLDLERSMEETQSS